MGDLSQTVSVQEGLDSVLTGDKCDHVRDLSQMVSVHIVLDIVKEKQGVIL